MNKRRAPKFWSKLGGVVDGSTNGDTLGEFMNIQIIAYSIIYFSRKLEISKRIIA